MPQTPFHPSENPNSGRIKIGVVGPCAAGKSTLVRQLLALGFFGKHIAQEHSYVPAMWKRITNPDVLVYLHASYPVTLIRRRLNWTMAEYQEQLRRLEHARQNASLIIDTDPLTADQVLEHVISFLGNRQILINHEKH